MKPTGRLSDFAARLRRLIHDSTRPMPPQARTPLHAECETRPGPGALASRTPGSTLWPSNSSACSSSIMSLTGGFAWHGGPRPKMPRTGPASRPRRRRRSRTWSFPACRRRNAPRSFIPAARPDSGAAGIFTMTSRSPFTGPRSRPGSRPMSWTADAESTSGNWQFWPLLRNRPRTRRWFTCLKRFAASSVRRHRHSWDWRLRMARGVSTWRLPRRHCEAQSGARRPLLLLGTAFMFVRLLDHLADTRPATPTAAPLARDGNRWLQGPFTGLAGRRTARAHHRAPGHCPGPHHPRIRHERTRLAGLRRPARLSAPLPVPCLGARPNHFTRNRPRGGRGSNGVDPRV